jgi:hypothetical protein
MTGVVTLSAGDSHHLQPGKDRIVYAGMPTPDVFSIVVRKWEFVYRGYAWNLYFGAAEQKIRIDGVNLTVESVSPTSITLRG